MLGEHFVGLSSGGETHHTLDMLLELRYSTIVVAECLAQLAG